MITIGQTSFLIRILESNAEIADSYDLNAEDTFDKLESMSEKQRSAIHNYLVNKRYVRIKQILNTLKIAPSEQEKHIMKQDAQYDEIKETI